MLGNGAFWITTFSVFYKMQEHTQKDLLQSELCSFDCAVHIAGIASQQADGGIIPKFSSTLSHLNYLTMAEDEPRENIQGRFHYANFSVIHKTLTI